MASPNFRKLQTDPVLVGQGAFDLPGINAGEVLYPTSHLPEQPIAPTIEAVTDWDVRNHHTGSAFKALNIRNKGIGAATLPDEAAAAAEIDRQYVGGRSEISDRVLRRDNEFRAALRKACGACVLITECSLANDPDKFGAKYHYASARKRQLATLRRDKQAKC